MEFAWNMVPMLRILWGKSQVMVVLQVTGGTGFGAQRLYVGQDLTISLGCPEHPPL